MKLIDKKINQLLDEGVNSAIFPGSAAGIYIKTRKIHNTILLNSGNSQLLPRKIKIKNQTFFDLASLSKPLSTVLSLISLVYAGKISVDQKLKDLLPSINREEKKEITILQLLNHSSGLPAYRPFFHALSRVTAPERQAELIRMILEGPLESKPGTCSVYSDLGYLLLGLLVEETYGSELDHCFRHRVAAPRPPTRKSQSADSAPE